MKLSSWAWAWALSGCLFMGNAMAQGLQQPFSVRPAGFDYYRYLQDEAPSPSDAEVEGSGVAEAAPEAAQQPAPVVDAGSAPSYSYAGNCDPCNAPSCCDTSSSCRSGCGLDLGCLDCCLGDEWKLSSLLFCEDSDWSIGGWSQWGYHNKDNFQFNSAPGKFHAQQQWVYIDKAANPTASSWDWGFHADLMYGIDANDTNAFGNTIDANGNPRGWDTGWLQGNLGTYGWALPQVYGTLNGENWEVKAGHFYTIIGYEVVQAPDNFFYSHAYTMYNSEPFTHTGVLASYSVNDNVEVFGGWTLGWDTGFDQFEDGSNFIGGISWTLTDDLSVTYASVIGDFGFRGDDGYMQSVVVQASLTENLDYVFQTDWLDVQEFNEQNYGINQYLFYTINDCLKLGVRAEWWKTDPLIAGAGNVSVNEVTAGVNYFFNANMRIRPEVRQEWIPAVDFDQTIFAVDAIVTF